jgi:hypothetical protein
LKALEETCYAESSRFYIQSPVDSQDSAMVTSGVPPETQMSMPMQLLQQAHGILSAVSIAGLSVAQSIGIDPEAVNECIVGLSAMQPLDLEKIGAAQSGAINRGLARSDAGASCSISDGVFGNPTTEISGIAEDAEAAKTKKATVHEEETSCSISDGVNGNPTTKISGIAEAARAAKTKKSAPRKNAAKVASKNPAGENAATSRSMRSSLRPHVVKYNGEVVKNYGALAGGDDTSPAKPIKKHAKR